MDTFCCAREHDLGVIINMGKQRYSKEFKTEAIKLLRESDKPIGQLAKTVGVSAKSLRDWAKQAAIDGGKGVPNALTSEEKADLAKLRRENRELRRERDFLKQAAAYFAKVNP
jgi:transposase